MIWKEKLTTGKRSLLVVDLKDSDLSAVSRITVNFFDGKKEENSFWLSFDASALLY